MYFCANILVVLCSMDCNASIPFVFITPIFVLNSSGNLPATLSIAFSTLPLPAAISVLPLVNGVSSRSSILACLSGNKLVSLIGIERIPFCNNLANLSTCGLVELPTALSKAGSNTFASSNISSVLCLDIPRLSISLTNFSFCFIVNVSSPDFSIFSTSSVTTTYSSIGSTGNIS